MNPAQAHFSFSISMLYDDDLVCKRQKLAQAHGFCILWLSTIGLQSCLGVTKNCTGTWFLRPKPQHYMTLIASGSGKNLHRRTVFASSNSALYGHDRIWKRKNLHRHMIFASSNSLYGHDRIWKRQKPAQAHGFCIQQLSVI